MVAHTDIWADGKTVVAVHLVQGSIEYVPEQIVQLHRDSMCCCEIQQYQSCSQLVWSVLSVNWANISKTSMSNMNCHCELTIWIARCPCLLSRVEAVSWMVEYVNLVYSDSVNLFNFAMWPLHQQAVPHWAGPVFWWMATNMKIHDTYHTRASGLRNSTV